MGNILEEFWYWNINPPGTEKGKQTGNQKTAQTDGAKPQLATWLHDRSATGDT